LLLLLLLRARTNFADTRTRAHLFVLLLFVAKIPQTLEERFFFTLLS
jgi:hypothetical protein